MKLWTKILAILLAVSLVGTALPSTALAADTAEKAQDMEEAEPQAEENETGKQEDSVTPQEGQESSKSVQKANARTVEEEYTTLTEGQELHQKTGNQETYVFAPEKSGYYRLACESVNGQNFYFRAVKCLYYTEDEAGNPEQQVKDIYYSAAEQKMERIVWLNQEEQYVFICSGEDNYSTDEYDFRLQVDYVEIQDITVAQNPTVDSYEFLNYEGMKIQINYVDGSNTVSDVQGYRYDSDCRITAFGWSDMAYNRQYRMESYAYLKSVDGEEKDEIDVKSLETGSHEAVLQICEYAYQGETSKAYDFEMEFVVSRGNVESLKVQNPKTEYTQDFNEKLGDFELLVAYNDGTEDKTLTSSDREVSQYLKYRVETEKETTEETTTDIDTYLRNGGSTGEATVTVTYRGSETTYKINIQENPYERMEITPERTVYYKDCGDRIEDEFKVVLYKNDGTQKSYNGWYSLPDRWGRGNYGLKLEEKNSYYRNIDDFISDGGNTGEQEMEVSYCGMKAACSVTVKENPYDHIEIAQQPTKLKYLHSKYQSLDLSGMVISAYKDAEETECDSYRYNDYKNYKKNPGNMTEEQYYIMRDLFDSTLGGHDNIRYLEPGEHTVSVSLMGHKAEYNIEVIEKMAESLTIVQAPKKLSYYANSNSYISLSGLIIEAEDLEGNVTKYKYNYNPSDDDEGGDDGYGDWWEIENSDFFSYSSDIDWSKPGNYTVTLEYLGAEASYQVNILPDPVKELKITKAPNKMSYYQYETDDINLDGMEYEVTFQDGTSVSGKADRWNCYFDYQGEEFYMPRRWKTTFNGEVKPGENTVVVSAFGAKADIDGIIVKENPVKSMEVVKNPEKTQYAPWDSMVDLFGMELLVTYVDGSSESVAVSEHVSQKEIDNPYGGVITAYKSTYWTDDDERRNCLRVSYLNESTRILLPELDLSELESVGLTDEENYHTVLTEEKPYCVYSFTPAETKEYHFFSTGTFDNYVYLYEGNEEITDNDDGGEGYNFRLTRTLEMGKTYYYVVSHNNFGKAAEFDCYFSSSISSVSELEVTDFEITKPAKDKYYDFESDHIYAYDLELSGTEYRIVYSNGWTKTGAIGEDYGSSITIGGTRLSVKWKYIVWDEDYDDEYAEKRDDNALVYTYGDKVIEFPVQFDMPGPVESLTVAQHPWMDKGIFEYQTGNPGLIEISFNIHYNDGREDETAKVTWKRFGSSSYYNGYSARLSWKEDEIQPGQENIIMLSYMGKTAEIPVRVLENPVESMQVLELPEKTEYYPFEYDEDDVNIDLYGMKLQINYKDGTKQTVEGTVHGSKVEVPDAYEEVLSAYMSYSYDEDDVERRVCYISYMGCRIELMPVKIRQFTLEDSVPLALDEENKEDMSGGYKIFSFTAPETGNYRFWYALGDYGDDYYDYDNWIAIYSAAGRRLAATWRTYLDYEMTGGKQYYLAAVIYTPGVGNITGSITRQPDRERENIQTVSLSLRNPNAGDWLQDYYDYDYDECYVSNYEWLNDAGYDEIADYGTAHRLMLTLKPYSSYQFTSATSVMVNGKRVATKSIGNDGKLTLYYTFPYTRCKVTIPNVEGYELDESQNADVGVCNYGEDYRFRYTKNSDNTNSSKLIVKAGDTVLTPDAEGYYLIEKVVENVNVTVKTNDLQAGEDESRLDFYNRSTDIFDIMTGKRNAKIADNENSEKSLPVLKSYADGSDRFFYGWYLDKDDSVNGKGTRFTSQSILLNPAYSLYAKWGSGYFTYMMNNKQINCKILSIDEYNKTKVQVGDAGNKAVNTASAARAFSNNPMLAGNIRGAGDSSTLVIPETIDLNNNADLAKLGIDFAEGEVTSIAENAFAGQEGITNISLPKTIEHIGSGAFANCTALEAIEIPEGVSNIGESAFSGCESLQTVSIPSSVSAISQGMFQGCKNLESVSIAEGVSQIEAGAFDGCTNLTTVTLPDSIEAVDASSFAAGSNLTIICSNEMKNSEAVQAVQEATGASVVAVDVNLNYIYNEKQFTYGDKAQTFTASISVDNREAEREIVWTYPDTTAYNFAVSRDKNSLTVTPSRVTAEDEDIVITASDKETGRSRSVTLKTNAIDLDGEDGDGDSVYSIREIGSQDYTGEQICPQVVVENNFTKEALGTENYDVSYRNNIYVGTAYVTVQGKGNYTGSITRSFQIQGTAKDEQILTVSATEIVKNVGDAPFGLVVSTSGDGTLSYHSSDTSVATVGNTSQDRGMVTIVGAGTTDITVTASETERYNSASKVIRLTVNAKGGEGDKKTPVITASDIVKIYGNSDFTVNASVTGNGSLTYAGSNDKVITVDAATGKVKIVGAGTANIVIKAAANQEYNEAEKTIKVTVQQADAKLMVTKKSYTKAYGETPFKLAVSAKATLSYKSSNTKVAEYKNGKVVVKACGTADITVSVNDGNYRSASGKITIQVLPKKASISKAVSKKAGQVTVTWKKQKEAAGYVVQYSTDKKFKKKVKTVNVNKNKTTSATINKLSKGSKYYVRVMAYTKVGKKQQCGAVSKALIVNVKK